MAQELEGERATKQGSDVEDPPTVASHEYHLKPVVAEEINVPSGRRDLDEKTVVQLMESMAAIGLRNPITVRLDGPTSPHVLVSGAHRLEAAKRLKWNAIAAMIIQGETDISAAIAEIDENLIRHNLTASEQALAIEKRADLVKAQAEERSGPNGPQQRKGKNWRKGEVEAASTRDLKDKTGLSEGTVKRARKRSKALGTETLEQVQGTDLDKPGELDALAGMSEAERNAKVAEAVAEANKPASERKTVSAREPKADAASEPDTGKFSQRLLHAFEAWKKCSRRERQDLMKMIKAAEEAEQKKNRTTVAAS